MYDSIEAKLAKGQIIIIDGGTGTDIQRRGASMSGDTWCAEVNISHPEVVKEVHQDYIHAGAELIISNTFATSPLLFNALGRDEDIIAIDKAAVSIAKAAAAGKTVAVAGSMSTMLPVVPGSDRISTQREWPETQARSLYKRKADNLASCRVDLIMMELMRDIDYSVWATEAALMTRLPVWVGISAERRADGKLTGAGRADQMLDDVVQALAAAKPAVISIMHTSPEDSDEALDILRKHWDGPMGCYPKSGYFKMPEWTFVDIVTPEELVAKTKVWRQKGVTIFGGCCGLGPEHIAALSREYAT